MTIAPPTLKVEMTRTESLTWAAGLFEGEGSCFVAAGKAQRQPTVVLVMTDEDVVRKFAGIIGVGYVNSYKRPGQKRYWRWAAQSRNDVLEALGLLWPYLGERRQEKATEVLERAAAIIPRGTKQTHCKRGHHMVGGNVYVWGRKRYCRSCRVLNRQTAVPVQ